MTRMETRWALTLFDTMLPSGANVKLPVGASGVPMAAFLREMFAHVPAPAALGLRAAVFVITWLAPLVIGRPGPFGRLGEADRVRVLEKLAHSPVYLVRELPMLVKTVAVLGYGGLPQIQQQVGVVRVDATPPAWAAQSPDSE